MRRIWILTLSLLAALVSSASASTVTLNGGCPSNLINSTSNYLNFNLSNSGNGAAQDIIISPVVQGAQVANQHANITFLQPGTSNTVYFYLQNLSLPGSYFEYFVVKYQQDGQFFNTSFPCYANIFRSTQSNLTITNLKLVPNKNQYMLSATITNNQNFTVPLLVSLVVPQGFSIIGISRNSIMLQQGRSSGYTATFMPIQGNNATYPVEMVLSYQHNNVHYAHYMAISVATSVSQQTRSSSDAIFWLIGAVVAILLALIVYSLTVKRKKHQ